jgi:hypothetical protein
MRIATLVVILVLTLTLSAQAQRYSPGLSFTASLQSETTGSTATMIWQTYRRCDQFNVFSFLCLGKWRCEGAACPGRHGRLQYIFDRSRYDQVYISVSGRPGLLCVTYPMSSPEPLPGQPPFDWRYFCNQDTAANQVDAGTVHVEWNLPE